MSGSAASPAPRTDQPSVVVPLAGAALWEAVIRRRLITVGVVLLPRVEARKSVDVLVVRHRLPPARGRRVSRVQTPRASAGCAEIGRYQSRMRQQALPAGRFWA